MKGFKGVNYVQSVKDAFSYIKDTVNLTILPALTDISSAQVNPIKYTFKAVYMLMDYSHTFPNDKIPYERSDMILHVDLDSVLVLSKACS